MVSTGTIVEAVRRASAAPPLRAEQGGARYRARAA
jgi:hypothetical protein